MAIAELGNHGRERIQHIEIGARIEVGGSQRSRGVQDEQVANPRDVGVVVAELTLDAVSEVDDFPLLASLKCKFLHLENGRLSCDESRQSDKAGSQASRLLAAARG
jgi:hypothetical protein